MKRSTWACAGTAAAGAALMVVGFAGTGQAAVALRGAPYALIPLQPDSFSGHSVVVRWAPCITTNGKARTHVIHYRVNPAGKTSRIKLAQGAVARLASASGLTFAYDGTTSYIPHSETRGGQAVFQALDMERKAHAPFVIAWARRGSGSGASNLLTSSEAGVGTVSWRSSPSSQLRINDGAVVIRRDAGTVLKPGFGPNGHVGSLLLHELGHAVGLEHSNPGQIMYPLIGPGTPANYAAGDRAGLKRVGAAAGCMRTPRLPAVNHF